MGVKMDSRYKLFEQWAIKNEYNNLDKQNGVYVDEETENAYYGFLGALDVIKNFAWGVEV
jgi:hypothetical protein